MKKLIVVFALLGSTAWADLSANQSKAVVSMAEYHGNRDHHTGTAWFCAPNHLVTAAHCLESKNGPLFIYVDGKRHQVQIVREDRNIDIAILYSPHYTSPTHLKVDTSTPVLNRNVMSYGNFAADSTYRRARFNYAGQILRLIEPGYNHRKGYANTRVWPGFSGGPIIDRKTNKVQGVITNHDEYYNCIFTRSDEFIGFLKSK